MPHAPHSAKGRLSGKHVLDVIAIEPDLSDDGVRPAVTLGNRADPARLADGIGGIPFGLHVNRGHDVESGAIASIVFGKIAASNRPIVAIAKRNRRFVAKPWMVVALQIPQMEVRIDDCDARARRRSVDHVR